MWCGEVKRAASIELLQTFPNAEELMRSDATRSTESTTASLTTLGLVPTLFVAFELGGSSWKLAAATGPGQAPRLRTVPARALARVHDELARAKARFHLPADAPVVSCYEAGRDGFWFHHALTAHAVRNHVVDSSSIEVNRRQRRAKSDRLDARKLLSMLLRYAEGERHVWHVVHVPSSAAEDQRQLHRELKTAQRERLAAILRVESLLMTQGLAGTFSGLEAVDEIDRRLAALRRWDATPLPPALQARLVREWGQVVALTTQLEALVVERARLVRVGDSPALAQVRQLMQLKGVGVVTAWIYVMEFFAWRTFRNRRELGALAGLAPTPDQSGTGRHRELGMSKAGNRWVRAVAIEGAWSWLRYQPASALSQWYTRRFAAGGSRLRRIGIVALARKLLIAFEQYLRTGTPPAGAAVRSVGRPEARVRVARRARVA
jgi:transposase